MWAARTISALGTQVSQLAVPLVALIALNADAFDVALLRAFQFVPFILFALPAGVWVDRWPRRPILIAADIGRALCLFSIPIAHALGVLTIWQLYFVAFVNGILTVFFDVAYQSYLPSLLQGDQLLEGNAKMQTTLSGAQIAGPTLGGSLIALVSAPIAIAADAMSFLFSGGLIYGVRKREQRIEGALTGTAIKRLQEGLRWVISNPYLRAQAMSTAISNLFYTMIDAVLIVFAVRDLHLTAQQIGIAFTVGNLGFFLGALRARNLAGRIGIGGATVLSTALLGPALLLIALAPSSASMLFLVAAQALWSFGAVIYNVVQVSLRQALTPSHLQGRMNSVMRFVVWGTIPLGALAGGAVSALLGLRTAIWIGAVGSALCMLPILFSPMRSLHTVEQAQATSQSRRSSNNA